MSCSCHIEVMQLEQPFCHGTMKCAQLHITPDVPLQQAVEGEDASCGLVGRLKSTSELKLAGSHVACSFSSPSGSAGPWTSVKAGLPSCTAAATATASAESGQDQLNHEVALQQAMLLLEELSDKNTELEMALQGSER